MEILFKMGKNMNNIQKLMVAIVGVILVGFLMVGSNKEKTNEFKANAAMIRAVSGMQSMANKKCPSAIKRETGDVVYFPTDTDTDKETYVSLTWDASKTDDKYSFQKAECTLHLTLGGISKLVIDDKTIIEKEVKY
jgi:hypothetical protein